MRIIIVTQTRVIFDAVHVSLSYMHGVKVVVMADRIGKAFVELSGQIFDVCLLDLDLPGALVAIPELNAYWPSMRLISLGGERMVNLNEPETRVEPVRREASVAEIANRLMERTGQAGLGPLASEMEACVQDGAGRLGLSLRERQIATLLTHGLSNKAIARELAIQPSTVKNHVHNILEKLGVSNRAKIASRMGMIGPRWV